MQLLLGNTNNLFPVLRYCCISRIRTSYSSLGCAFYVYIIINLDSTMALKGHPVYLIFFIRPSFNRRFDTRKRRFDACNCRLDACNRRFDACNRRFHARSIVDSTLVKHPFYLMHRVSKTNRIKVVYVERSSYCNIPPALFFSLYCISSFMK